jgi:type I restriction enzyme S subunit
LALAAEWRTARIEEITEKVGMGPFGSSIKVETFVPSGVPVISGQHLHGFKVDESVDFNFVSCEHADRLKSANVQRGDIIFTHAGNIRNVAYVPEDSRFERFVISQRQFYMRCDRSKVTPEFVVAYFKTPEGQHQLLANASSVGVPSIAQPVTYLRTIEIPVPPLPEQRSIAYILGTLDDKIELNHRMNRTLESIARAIFKSWFVDFDPVRKKMEGGEVGLPPALAALFPKSLAESTLGLIPDSWVAKPLGDLLQLAYGKALRAGDRHRGDIPVYGSNGRIGQHDSGLVAGPGIVIGRKGNPGTVVWSEAGFYPIDTTFFVVPKRSRDDLRYLRFALDNLDLPSLAADSAVPGLSRQVACNVDVLVPPTDVAAAFSTFVDPIMGLRHRLACECDVLARCRDALLPGLVSGHLNAGGG